MEEYRANLHADLGRYVICPKCGLHSDLEIDRQAVPLDDRAAYRLSIAGTALHGCHLFHEDPSIAWLYFKHTVEHGDHLPAVEEPTETPGYTPAADNDDFLAGVPA